MRRCHSLRHCPAAIVNGRCRGITAAMHSGGSSAPPASRSPTSAADGSLGVPEHVPDMLQNMMISCRSRTVQNRSRTVVVVAWMCSLSRHSLLESSATAAVLRATPSCHQHCSGFCSAAMSHCQKVSDYGWAAAAVTMPQCCAQLSLGTTAALPAAAWRCVDVLRC